MWVRNRPLQSNMDAHRLIYGPHRRPDAVFETFYVLWRAILMSNSRSRRTDSHVRGLHQYWLWIPCMRWFLCPRTSCIRCFLDKSIRWMDKQESMEQRWSSCWPFNKELIFYCREPAEGKDYQIMEITYKYIHEFKKSSMFITSLWTWSIWQT